MWWLGFNLSVAVAVGFIALAGVAAETGVVMLIYLNQALERVKARRDGRGPATLTRGDLHDAIMEGAVERVRPKMMTVVAIMAGLLPIMWSTGTGSEIMQRIAVPMIGGMVSSTLLTLIVIPAIYGLVKGFRLPGEHRSENKPLSENEPADQPSSAVACAARFSYTVRHEPAPPLPRLRRRAAVRSRPGRARYRFQQGVGLLGRSCRLRARGPGGAVSRATRTIGGTRRARSATPSFLRACAARSASTSPTRSFWKDGTRSSSARCPASRRCWRAPPNACRSMLSPTPTAPHVEHFSVAYADVLGHFREIFLSSAIGLRKPDAAAYDHVVKAIGVPAERIVFFDDLAENIEGARARGPDRAFT